MSFDTYISIVITSIVAIVVGLFAVLFPMVFPDNIDKKQGEQEKNRKGGKKRRNRTAKFSTQKINQKLTKFHKIAIAFALLGVIVLVGTTVVYQTQKPNKYNESINKAEFEYGNHNYLEAAKYYNEAAYVAYNVETKVTALYCEGACYLQLGLSSDNDNYLSQALSKYYAIIDNRKYKNAEYYQDALIDSSFALRELYSKWDDENLRNIIYQLEDVYDFSDIENIPLEKVDLMNKVALAIAQYYKYAANENFELQNKSMTKELSDKAIYYYGVVCQLMPQADSMHFKNTDLIGLYLEISELMIKGSISSENYMDALTNFNNTIKYCKSAIDTFDEAEKNVNELSSYLRLKINLGKSYYLLSGLEGEEYLSKAYDELKPLLYLNVNRDIEYILLDAGYYLILTKKCTEEEIDIILDRYENQLDGLTIENENYLTLTQSTLEACKFIADLYEGNSRAIEKSEDLSRKVDSLLSVYGN